jgi:demethylmenaquinone methyltransferase/2-methoxy-6-polyprenyl-1,4-benzoquinol methylase
MLEIARAKVEKLGLLSRVDLVTGDAESLPFADASFDGVCIAFGIRNVPDRDRALAEMARVTKPGGHVAVLELSEPKGGIMGPLARFHVHTVVPYVGALLSGAPEYRYLQRSIAAFPPAEEFANRMRRAGLEMEPPEALTFGVCHLYVGERGKPA